MKHDSEAAQTFLVPEGTELVTLSAFRPGRDRVLVRASRLDTVLLAEELEIGVALVLRSGADSEVQIVFDRLDTLPLADISIDVPIRDGLRRVVSLADLAGVEAPDVRGAVPSPKHKPTAPMRLPRPITEFVLKPGQPIPRFSAFTPGAHLIEVDMAVDGPVYPRVDVRPSADGLDGVLLLDGRAAAILNGAPYATPADIRLMPRRSDG